MCLYQHSFHELLNPDPHCNWASVLFNCYACSLKQTLREITSNAHSHLSKVSLIARCGVWGTRHIDTIRFGVWILLGDLVLFYSHKFPSAFLPVVVKSLINDLWDSVYKNQPRWSSSTVWTGHNWFEPPTLLNFTMREVLYKWGKINLVLCTHYDLISSMKPDCSWTKNLTPSWAQRLVALSVFHMLVDLASLIQ